MHDGYKLLKCLYLYIILMATISKSLKVAVVGGGYAGLSVAIRLIDQSCRVSLYDRVSSQHHNGASVASSGLLHGMTPKGKLIWKGKEGYASAITLMNRLENAFPDMKIVLASGSCIYRPLLEENSIFLKQLNANRESEYLEYIPPDAFKLMPEGMHLPTSYGAIAYKTSAIIDSIAYLTAMKQLLTSSHLYNHVHHQVSRDDLSSLSASYDAVILAVGAGIKHLWPSSSSYPSLPVSYAGGQNIIIPNHQRTSKALLLGEYAVPMLMNGHHMLLCGSTKEYIDDFDDDVFINNHHAEAALRPKLELIIPSLSSMTSSMISSYPPGIRVIPKRSGIGRLPIADRFPYHHIASSSSVSSSASSPYPSLSSSSLSSSSSPSSKDNIWFITGLASRGLIHHAILSEWMCNAVVHDDATMLPHEIRLPPA